MRIISALSAITLITLLAFYLPRNKKSVSSPFKTIELTVHEGTNMAVAVSPDKQMVALDLQGRLWLMLITGGEAKPITDEFGDARQPYTRELSGLRASPLGLLYSHPHTYGNGSLSYASRLCCTQVPVPQIGHGPGHSRKAADTEIGKPRPLYSQQQKAYSGKLVYARDLQILNIASTIPLNPGIVAMGPTQGARTDPVTTPC